MYTSLRGLLKPFERDYVRYTGGVFVRQALLVAGGYSMVLAMRWSKGPFSFATWVFVAAFLLYDAGLLSLDIGLNWFFTSRLGYPLFGKLRSAALAKVFEMPLEWHHQKESGRLAGEVNTGVGKVVQTAESISRELVPALLRTGLSLIPLLLVTPLTAPAALLALLGFVWLSLIENRKREPYRRSRNEKYNADYGLFAECVQQVRPVLQFGQTRRMLRNYDQIQRSIIDDGMREARLGNIYSWRRNMLLSVTKRACQGMWLYQFRAGILDGAMVMYLSMLLEELLNSFWGYAALLDRIFDGLEPTRILVKLLEERPSIVNAPDARPQLVTPSVGIRLVNLGFSYSGRSDVMHNLNLAIEPGSHCRNRRPVRMWQNHDSQPDFAHVRLYSRLDRGVRRGRSQVAAGTVAQPVLVRDARRRRLLLGYDDRRHDPLRPSGGDHAGSDRGRRSAPASTTISCGCR